jgi:hypothetical protein
MAKETLQLMTTRRNELKDLRALMRQGNDSFDAWYVTSPVLSRLVYTQFQDRGLAIALGLDEVAKQKLRQAEVDHILAAMPNPLIKLLSNRQLGLVDPQYDKNQIGGCSLGAYMLYLGGTSTISGAPQVRLDEDGRLVGDVFATGGFIGDGMAAYGWWYLVLFAGLSFLLFLFADTLYGFAGIPKAGNSFWEGGFAVVGLINGYTLATILSTESFAEFVRFIFRQPFQWLVVYAMVFWSVRFVGRALFGGRTIGGGGSGGRSKPRSGTRIIPSELSP